MKTMTLFFSLLFCMTMVHAQTDLMAGHHGEMDGAWGWCEFRYAGLPGTNNPWPATNQNYDNDAHTGSYSMKLTQLITGGLFDYCKWQNDGDPITITEGNKYTYKVWAKTSTQDVRISTKIIFMDGATPAWPWPDVKGEFETLTDLPGTNTWTELSVGGMAPVGSDAAMISITFKSATTGDIISDGVFYIDDVQLYENLGTGIQSINSVKSSLYPNPSKGIINLTSDQTIQSASIFSLSGQKIKTLNSTYKNINVSDINPGIYFVKMVTNGGESTQRLIIK
jgi:hypothetical protein